MTSGSVSTDHFDKFAAARPNTRCSSIALRVASCSAFVERLNGFLISSGTFSLVRSSVRERHVPQAATWLISRPPAAADPSPSLPPSPCRTRTASACSHRRSRRRSSNRAFPRCAAPSSKRSRRRGAGRQSANRTRSRWSRRRRAADCARFRARGATSRASSTRSEPPRRRGRSASCSAGLGCAV